MNRRAFERFSLPPMLSPITVQRVRDGKMETLTGHAYDISEGGMRIEVDEPVAPGERLNITFVLPGFAEGDAAGTVCAACEVVWLTDAEDDPAFLRAGVRIVQYLDGASAQRMLNCFGGRWLRRAA
jgi:hypothetical protein